MIDIVPPPAPALRPPPRLTLTDHVHERIRDAICAGELRPGRKLVIDQLARELGVSITPVREALARLRAEGLAREIPFSGMVVSDLSPDELQERYAIRGALEGCAVRRAAERLDEDALAAIGDELDRLEAAAAAGDVAAFRDHNQRFHDAILAAAGWPTLAELIGQMERATERYRRAAVPLFDQRYLDAAQAEHRQLFALLRARRSDEAAALAQTHALTFAVHLARSMETSGEDRQDRDVPVLDRVV